MKRLEVQGPYGVAKAIAAVVGLVGLLLPMVGQAGQLRQVDQRGLTPGAYSSITAAVAAVAAGDTISLVPGSGPYRETLQIEVAGTEAAPITVEGNGETVTGFDPFQFSFNASSNQWEYVLPPPNVNTTAGALSDPPFRHLITYNGQRLIVDAATGKLTSDFATLSPDGLTLILGNASPTSGWEIGVRKFVVRVLGVGPGSTNTYAVPIAWHHIYRNLRVSGSAGDGINLHGSGTNLRFENVESFNNWDEGYSAHDSIESEINGGAFWGNDNGLFNQTTSTTITRVNNARVYANLGIGFSLRGGVNVLTNSQAWDNGIENMAAGGTLTSYSNTSFESRWSRRQWVNYQETQAYTLNYELPYAWQPYWKGLAPDLTHQAFDLTGEEPTILGADRLPPFSLAYDDWRYVYFSGDALNDVGISGKTADPDSDARSNLSEYQDGTRPQSPDTSPTVVTVAVPDAVATEAPGNGASFIVRRRGDTSSALTVNYGVSGTATPGDDYTALSGSVEIPAGSTAVSVPLSPLEDSVADPGETVTLKVSPDAAYVLGAASGTIVIDPVMLPVVTITVGDPSASEVAGETATLRIRRSGSTAAELPVNFTLGGTATEGADYSPLGTSTVIPAGSSFVDLVINALDDGLAESTETVVVTLQKDPRYVVAGAIASAQIEGAALATVSLSVPDASATEVPGNTGTFRFTRSSGLDYDLTVFFRVEGTATSDVDYEAIEPSVVIPAGQASADVTVYPIYDTVAETSETVLVTISTNAGYVRGTPNQGTVTITNFVLPTVSLTASDATASEAAGNTGAFTFSRTGPKTSPLAVFFTIDGTATPGSDYTALPSSVIIPTGSSSVTVLVTPNADNLIEGTETVVASLTANASYAQGTATATINVADVPPPTVTVAVSDGSASEAEGDPGRFTISRSGAKTNPLTVYFTLGGSSTNGSDYSSVPLSAEIPSGASSATVTIAPLPDNLTEGTETAVLTLASDAGYQLGTVVTGSINIKDVALGTVTLAVTDASASEAAGNPGAFTFTRTGAKTLPLTVYYSLGGSATNGVDYSSLGGSVQIPAAATSVTVSIAPLADSLTEGTETVVPTLVANGYYLNGAAVSGTISIEDVVPVTVSVQATDADASESGDPGVFTFSRSGSTAAALTVAYTVGGTASSGSDYTSLSGSVVIAAGTSSASVSLTPLSDTLSEGSETVVLGVASGTGYGIGSSPSATVTIADVAATSVSLSVSDDAASESGDVGSFLISRSGSTLAALPVYFSLGGTATEGSDYSALGSVVEIPAGASAVTVTVAPSTDILTEGSESVVLTLVSHAGYELGTPVSGTVSIADVAPPSVTVDASDASASETGDSGSFSVYRSGATDASLSVAYTLGGTASNGADYTMLSGTVLIPAGASSATVTVVPGSDALVEGSETVVLSLSAGASYELGTPASATVNIEDVPPPTVNVAVSDANASESGDPGSFSISRSGATDASLSVAYTLGGTASNGTDYAALSGTVVIPAGASAVTVTVAPSTDTASEGTETVVLTLSAAAAYQLGASTSGTVQIADVVTPSVSVVASDAAASEAVDTGAYTISRSGPTDSALLVRYSLSGSATDGVDYSSLGSSVSIPAGASSVTVLLTPLRDTVTEGTETAVLQLVADPAYVASGGSASISIANVAPVTVSLTVTDGSASEAAGNPGNFTISRTGSKTTPMTVYISVGGTAINGTDYQAIPTMAVEIPANSSSVQVVIQPLPDLLVEGNEAVALSVVDNASYLLGTTTSGSVTVLDVPPPTITLATTDGSASEAEGNPGRFTISRSGAKTNPITIYYAVSGTASNGSDYTALSGSVDILAGASTAVVDITTLPDTLTEGNETVVITVSSNPNYIFGGTVSGTVSIVDVALGTVTLTVGDSSASETGPDAGSFTVTRTGSKTLPLTVYYSLSGSAANGVDYTSLSGSVVIPAAATSATVTVTPLADALVEGAETVVPTLLANGYYLNGATTSGTITLQDAPAP